MGWTTAVREMWERVAGAPSDSISAEAGERRTVTTPLSTGLAMSPIFAPFRGTGAGSHAGLPKPTAANLRRFAETPVVRRAINCTKDKIACMNWRIVVAPEAGEDKAGDRAARVQALTRAFAQPNATDSFRTLIEQVIEDTLVGGFGAAEIEATDDAQRPVELYPVDGASIQVNALWSGSPDDPRYAQVTSRAGAERTIPLRDDQLMYVRLNPRTHTVFGLGKVEVAFETISQFLQAHRYAGRLASNSVVQYALWLNERTPEQHERLIRWWQDEVEGTGRVPILSSDAKPEVLRFAGGTDADLRLAWQEFLVTMIANAFDLPPMLLGQTQSVNKAAAGEYGDEAFQSAIVPLAKLIAEHLTRDVIAKKLGWNDLRSSVDCESAAQAVLAFATSRDAALSGTYTAVNPAADVWPGDVLAVTSAGVTTSLLVRSVVIKDGGAVPEVREYKLGFANDWAAEWAAGIGLKLSEEIAADAYLPQTASAGPTSSGTSEVLANLQQLAVTGLTGTALQVDAGTAPPAGGGFEVRLADWHFGPQVDAADLVLRSPVRSFSIPLAAQVQRFYVRMYDASTPPLYSRFSSAVFVHTTAI